MNIAIDTSPLSGPHERRGIGWYTHHLIHALKKYENSNKYTYFTRTEKLPTNSDIVHYPYFDPFFLTLPTTHNKKRSVVTIHDLIPLLYPEKFKPGIRGKLIWHMQKRRASNYGAIITDSKASKTDIINIMGVSAEKVHIVHLAAGDEFKIVSDKRALNGIQKKYNLKKFFLYVGDVNFNKNIHSLISAFQHLSADYSDLDLALVGDGFLGSSREARKIDTLISNLDISGRVKRLGFVPTSDLIGLYNCATGYIQPSLYEGFGLPILEAMACGCPVVASGGGSLAEVVGDAAIIIDPQNTDSIERGMEVLIKLGSLERKKIIAKGLLQSEKFSWEKTAHQTLQVYKTLI